MRIVAVVTHGGGWTDSWTLVLPSLGPFVPPSLRPFRRIPYGPDLRTRTPGGAIRRAVRRADAAEGGAGPRALGAQGHARGWAVCGVLAGGGGGGLHAAVPLAPLGG